ncbi:Inner membrane protein yhjD [Proteus mirabilis]|uniref:Inner membrane protein yhjD n=1 Tax=Proteus mirabilis TaxID=584 RepID=A0A379GDB3_PROMI|nr:Inner membrane protein yhjD [Proteus mirabilis]
MSEETQKKASNKNTQLTQPIKHGLEKGLHGGKKAIGIGIKFTNFVTNIPFIAHLIRAAERFTDRMGNQFGAAITYFSFLSINSRINALFCLCGFYFSFKP